VAAAAASAAIVTGLSGGNLSQMLRAGVIAGATAFAFYEVGDLTLGPAHASPAFDSPSFNAANYAENVAGHALVGCGAAVANGSSCGSGALSGAVTASAGPLINGQSYGAALAENAVLGGAASVAGGGKFANGAITGAFGYMFNACATGSACAPGTSGLLPGLPGSLQLAITNVGGMIYASGDADWEQRFDNWQVSYSDRLTGFAFGATDYQNQQTTFTRDTARLDQGELDFVVAHEFGHLLPENAALSSGNFSDAFRNPLGSLRRKAMLTRRRGVYCV
jgi:hypothetical protein